MPALRICALYPELMNIYADRGNIAVLRARCEWRGLGFELASASLGDPLDPDAHDLFYIGGGQDRDQVTVAHDLAAGKRGPLHEAAERGAVILAVCGGYQLLGHSYQLGEEDTLTTLAKGLAGALVGLALVTVLSLLAMARRVRRRGGFGRMASAVLRSAYAVVLGLGGWSLGVLIVLTTMPGVPLDDELLAALSVGLPIGLGIGLAWLNRNKSGETRVAGFVAAVGGALVGAWLGFHAMEGLAALLTAIVGAAAAANLLLIALDVAQAPPPSEPRLAEVPRIPELANV